MTSTSGGSYNDSLGYAKLEEERNKSSKVMALSQDLWEGMEKSDYGFLKRIIDTTTGFNVKALRFQAELIPSGKHNGKHRHKDEIIIHVVQGHGHTIVEDKRVDWKEGDTLYVPIWFWYQHFNDDAEVDAHLIAWSNGVLTEKLGLCAFELAEKANY